MTARPGPRLVAFAWARGRRPALPHPPALGVLTLPVLTSLALREWIIVTDAGELSICGHRYTVAGWNRRPAGLIVEHACPAGECR